jgi:glycine cleavage system H protein
VSQKEYKYSQGHEWVCYGGKDLGKMGLTDYAQSQLGDLVYLDLPEPGISVEQFKKIGEIESVKAVSDLFSPVSGKVLKVNQEAIDSPNIVNEEPYGKGWLLVLDLTSLGELDELMTYEEYNAYIATLTAEDSS